MSTENIATPFTITASMAIYHETPVPMSDLLELIEHLSASAIDFAHEFARAVDKITGDSSEQNALIKALKERRPDVLFLEGVESGSSIIRVAIAPLALFMAGGIGMKTIETALEKSEAFGQVTQSMADNIDGTADWFSERLSDSINKSRRLMARYEIRIESHGGEVVISILQKEEEQE